MMREQPGEKFAFLVAGSWKNAYLSEKRAAMEFPEFIRHDPWLKPYGPVLASWKEAARIRERELTGGVGELAGFAAGHLWFGVHRSPEGWTVREWAPNATAVYMTGTFSRWSEQEAYRFRSLGKGQWELLLPAESLCHGELYALSVHWTGGRGKRIPAWATRVVQDEKTQIFNAQVWAPGKAYRWKHDAPRRDGEALLIYEAHAGMAGEEERVHGWNEFREKILPRIKAAGYNTVQLMAVQEHPYYGSFGYHVSGFFAPSSRFGTPDELKELVDAAHGMGLSVIMDLVHSHAVKNEIEGLGAYDGTRYQFFHDGPRGEHPAWDSYCFDYGKPEVLHFLLSNIRYWLEEFRFDGFRFDGVTSMLYLDHGLGKAFTCYADYFSRNTDREAVTYLFLANRLIRQINPQAFSLAEDVSGMPGLAAPAEHGGMGFDYRMAMGVPDFWIRLIKELPDEQWNVGLLFHELTSRRAEERVVSYTESHDQALVGDKTILFRLIDKEMYYSMRKDQSNLTVDRGMALHKMIRLVTAATAGGAYLNFMGNEFGHPEWIDFPRQGNNWSFNHARRLWSLAGNQELRYHWLGDFDRCMIGWMRKTRLLEISQIFRRYDHKPDQVLAFSRGDFLLVFNFNPVRSFTGYGIPAEPSGYRILFDTDEGRFGGQDRIDGSLSYCSTAGPDHPDRPLLNLYLPARTALVLKRELIN
ncbi:MAG: alpha amylase C-terminal domain-containing protein [Mangrovibacterium sp.]